MINRHDKVRVSYYKQRQGDKRDFLYSKVGEVVLTFKSDVFVKFPDSHHVDKVAVRDCEKL